MLKPEEEEKEVEENGREEEKEEETLNSTRKCMGLISCSVRIHCHLLLFFFLNWNKTAWKC